MWRNEGKTPGDGLGDGQEAWKAFEEKHHAVCNAIRQELYLKLTETKMGQGQDPDIFLYIMETARYHLYDMGKYNSPERFGGLLLNDQTPDYNFVPNTSFINREFGLKEIKSTVRNMHADLLSCRSGIPSIDGRRRATPMVCSTTCVWRLDTARKIAPSKTPTTRPR